MAQTRIHDETTRRRGTVLIMVIGVLSMLFIVGATLLIVARFDRQTALTVAAGRNVADAAIALAEPSLNQLRQDVVGEDGVPYNRAWTGSDNSTIEDFADFPGRSSAYGDVRDGFRSGDLLLSSIEPYYTADRDWRLFAFSWPSDFVAASNDGPSNNVRISRWNSDPDDRVSPLTSQPRGDATGDGVRDVALGSTLDQTVAIGLGSSMELFMRVIPHGGMVLLDPMTHPSLLAQVIHPQDSAYHSEPWKLWTGANPLATTDKDEGRLRRRFMLPGFLGRNAAGNDLKASDLPQDDMRYKLPVTLGFTAPSSASAAFKALTPHYWPVDEEVVRGDLDWWEKRVTPGPALTNKSGDPGGKYTTGQDLYDRRRLITTANSDDILRPRRDEEALKSFAGQDDPNTEPLQNRERFHYIVNPETSAFPWDATLDDADNYARWDLPAADGGPLQYGRLDDTESPMTLHFNVAGLRTQFSLRDALEPVWNSTTKKYYGLPSYRRAMQLTAYYLAMLQGTSVPDNQRLRTAAQLAVNTIDFADNGDRDGDGIADVPDPITCFAWPIDNPVFEVFGVEKQPYLTEAYARQVIRAIPDTSNPGTYIWDDDPNKLPLESLYAIEIYNPYPEPLDITLYQLQVVSDKGESKPAITLDTSVVTNGGLIPGYGYIVIANKQPDIYLNGPTIGTVGTNVFVNANLEIGQGDRIHLVRTVASIVKLTPQGLATASEPLVVDQLAPSNLGATDGYWARPPQITGTTRKPGDGGLADPADDRLVRDSSLQRHKAAAGEPPVHWHFTLSRQMLLPPRDYELPDSSSSYDPPVTDAKNRPAQHNLLGTDPMKTHFGSTLRIGNQELVAKEFKGIAFTAFKPFTNFSWIELSIAERAPIAPFPVVVADRGVDPRTGGCIAFPTTGTLLMVTRYGHELEDSKENSRPFPLTVAVTREWNDPQTSLDRNELARLDNGHMPVWDSDQKAQDLNTALNGVRQSRLDVPWGQLVFDYFTALPLEELVRRYNLKTMGFDDLPTAARMVNLSTENYRRVYEAIFLYYPRLSPVAEAPSPLGARVDGRININIAPWWVLDGLPVLPDQQSWTGTATWPTDWHPLADLPLVELESGRLDPEDATYDKVGSMFLDLLIDEVSDNPPLGLPNVSPTLAKYMVSYRENREVDDFNANHNKPGFVTAGALCDLMTRVTIPTVKTKGGNLTDKSLGELRNHPVEATGGNQATADKPYSYLGYLQLLAPVVRMQDWVTVRNHAYTIYSVVGDGSLWLRSQVTVDRTRCLYTQDLPLRISETPPTGYYNAISD